MSETGDVIKENQGEGKKQCTLCASTFNTEEELGKHIKQHADHNY